MEEPLEGHEIKVANLSHMPPLEDHEEVKGEKGLKILTPNKPLNRLSILSAQLKIGSNSHKLKNEIIHMLYLLYQQNKITQKLYNHFIKLL